MSSHPNDDPCKKPKDDPCKKKDDSFRIDFIDPLFAVAIHIGLVEAFFNERWLDERSVPRSAAEWANILMFAAGIFVLVASWVGYHLSIKSHALIGNVRFALDVVLLLVYMLLLLYFQSFRAFSFWLAVIYVLYVVWDYFKTREYSEEYYGNPSPPNIISYLSDCFSQWMWPPRDKSSIQGEVVSLGWATFFVLVAPLMFVVPETCFAKYVFAVGVILSNILYRTDKISRRPLIFFVPAKIAIFVLCGLDLLMLVQFAQQF